MTQGGIVIDSQFKMQLTCPDQETLLRICGPEDRYLTMIETRLDVNIVHRGDTLTATGDKAIYLNISKQVTIVGHAHAQQVSSEKGSNKKQTSELFANKILYYPDEERTIAVGNVHATVYPGSDSGKKKNKDKDKKKDKKKKKKAKKSEDDIDNEDGDTDLEESMADIPAGDFTEIGGDNEGEKENE